MTKPYLATSTKFCFANKDYGSIQFTMTMALDSDEKAFIVYMIFLVSKLSIY